MGGRGINHTFNFEVFRVNLFYSSEMSVLMFIAEYHIIWLKLCIESMNINHDLRIRNLPHLYLKINKDESSIEAINLYKVSH